MARRRMSNYSLFMSSYLRTHLKRGATREHAQRVMKEGAAAWRRAIAGKNPFPELEIEIGAPRPAAGETACPECGAALEVPAGLAGETVACPDCGSEFAVEVR